MTPIPFDYSLLFRDHLSLAATVLLILSFLSCYIFKSIFLRGVFFFLALLLGLYAGRIDWIGLGLILLFGGVFYYGIHAKNKMLRGLFFLTTVLLSMSLFFVKVPGLDNWRVASNLHLSADGIPYSMKFNFDKSLIGLFFLCFSPLSLANGGKWKLSLKTGIMVGVLAILVLIPLSVYLGYVKFDLKMTSFFFLFALHNLLFVCIAEEALFRGMIQKFLMLRFQAFKMGKWVALFITATLFGAAHYPGGINYMLLALVAGLFYGFAFIKTEKIEASVLSHFMVNIVHFLAFTYPGLKSAF